MLTVGHMGSVRPSKSSLQACMTVQESSRALGELQSFDFVIYMCCESIGVLSTLCEYIHTCSDDWLP
jgi:hypothetical protein